MTIVRVRVNRPLRAFFVVIGGWTVMRVVVLWHASTGIIAPVVEASVVGIPVGRSVPATLPVARVEIDLPIGGMNRLPTARPQSGRVWALRAPSLPLNGGTEAQADNGAVTPAPWLPSTTATHHFSGSAWALFRPDSSGAALGTGGTLGGSQAGVRVFYEPGPHGLALTARLSAPLAMRLGREVSVGVGIRGRQAGILLERRIALDRGARNAMSVMAYGGISDMVLPYGLRGEGYVQFGIVGARSQDGFADGAVRIVHPVAQSGGAKLSAGGALSGGAQPGVARVDIGPELVGDIPVGGGSMRVTAGWRERVAGRAAPGSGPSLSIGVGF